MNGATFAKQVYDSFTSFLHSPFHILEVNNDWKSYQNILIHFTADVVTSLVSEIFQTPSSCYDYTSFIMLYDYMLIL